METFAFLCSYQCIRSAIIYTLNTVLMEECKKSHSVGLILYALPAFNHLIGLEAWNFEEDWCCKLKQFVIFLCFKKKNLLKYSVVNKIVIRIARILYSSETEWTLSWMEHDIDILFMKCLEVGK